MRIYIAGPYGRRNGYSEDQCVKNVRTACRIGGKLIAKGHDIFVPHLYHYVHINMDDPITEDEWLDRCIRELNLCEGIFLLPGWESSQGSCIERMEAIEKHLWVFHSLAQVPRTIDNLSIM